MKRVLSIALSLVLTLSVLSAVYISPASAVDVSYQQDGICYELHDDNTATVTGTDGSQSYQRYVKVRLLGGNENPGKLPTPKIKVSSAPKSLYVKQTATLNTSFVNAYDHDVKFTSSNSKIAKITSKGKITALKKAQSKSRFQILRQKQPLR